MNQSRTNKFLLALVKPYKHVVVVIAIFSILASCFDGISIGLLVPLLSNLQKLQATPNLPRVFQAFSELLRPYPAQQQVLFSLGFVLLAIVLKNLFGLLSTGLGHWFSRRLQADLRLQATSLLMRVGLEFHHQAKAAELIEKAMVHTNAVEYFVRMQIELMAYWVTLAALLGMLLVLSWPLTLVALLMGAILFALTAQLTKNASLLSKKEATANQELMNAVYESLGGIQLIKSYSKEHEQIPLLHEKVETSRRIALRRTVELFGVPPLMDVLGALGIVILFLLATLVHGMNTQLVLAQLLPFIYILMRIVPLVKCINGIRAQIAARKPYLELVYDLLRDDDKPMLANGTQIFSGLTRAIQFQAVSFAYNGAPQAVLREVDFAIPVGKTTALIGESGAGKSTIASLLLRLYDPQQGAILLDGVPLPNYKLESYHRRIGVVSQDTFLFSSSVKANIAFGAITPPSEEQILNAAKKADAHEFIMGLPNGYDTFVGDRGVKLSGGQRQRISIARALLRDPEILILDEATSALDTKTEHRIHQAILELSRGRTVIIIAHRLSTIKTADQIIVLKNGRIAEAGRAEHLLAQRGEYYHLTAAA